MPSPKYKNPALHSGVLKNLFKDSQSPELHELQNFIIQKLKNPKLQKKAADIISQLLQKDNKK